MAPFHASGHMEVRAGPARQAQVAVPQPDEPFHILLLGDFSARASRGSCEPATIAARPVIPIDRDNLDAVLGRLGVELRLRPSKAGPQEGPRLVLRFAELDDFSPDRLYNRLELFQSLRQLRRRLSDPQAFGAIVETLALGTGEEAARLEPPAAPPASAPPPAPTPQDLLETVLERSLAVPDSAAPPGPWDALVADIVRPYLLPRPDPRQSAYLAAVDGAAAELLRAILHHPAFQALEALWRGLDWLVRRLETDEKLKLFVLDISQQEWAEDLSGAELENTGLYKLLVERTVETPGGTGWAVIAAAFTFEPAADDARRLGRMAELARKARAPFIACADPRLLGCPSLAEHPDPEDWTWEPSEPDRQGWEQLRRLADARWLGLALPRFLVRLPYGLKTAPIERLAFEEMPAIPRHEQYLWGPPSFACALLLGQAFAHSGWSLHPGEVRDIDGLPVHTYAMGGETCMTPCAEVLWSDRAAAAVLQRGLMPLRSYAGRDRVRLERFQSLALPPALVAGRWRTNP